MADHYKIEQSQPPVVGDEHVARMRIGVKEYVHDDLVQLRADELTSKLLAVERRARERREGAHLRPADEIHRQHAWRRELVNGLRNDDLAEILRQMAPEDPQIGGLLPVIELRQHRLPELVDEL